ncbi:MULTISPECIES: hypothetical protein [unclassified Cellulosimicrobium]|uniref:Uncharacterized protein n=1 Tax=Cellulosimicrobium sp. ES-005 TaxID=3163031 RepID=A0AAU8FYD0_9MICO|nr:hypothetical protein [Cellulosimicrobium sp. TH-20]
MTTSAATARARASKRKGASYQSDVRNLVRDTFLLDVEILELSGTEDEGDLVIRLPRTGKYVIVEAKNEAKIDLPGYLREARAEAANYAKHRPAVSDDQTLAVAFVKARGKGTAESYAVMRAGDFLAHLVELEERAS